MKSLVVEDGFVSRAFLIQLLAPYGHCDVAVNGEEAIAAVQQSLADGAPYDLVCLDIRMPDCSGTDVLERLHELEAEAGILLGDGAKVFMTTSSSEHVVESFRANCDAYLMKPIEPAQVHALVEQHVGLPVPD